MAALTILRPLFHPYIKQLVAINRLVNSVSTFAPLIGRIIPETFNFLCCYVGRPISSRFTGSRS